MNNPSFENLNPDLIISSVEKHLNTNLSGVINPYNSYVNRVYGVQDEEDNRFIVKFYRPERWSKECILDEHKFLFQCSESEIPVAAPLITENKESLGFVDGFNFAVFPLKAGRSFDICSDQDWLRLGSIIGRLHQLGKKETANNRLIFSPEETTKKYCKQLLNSKAITPNHKDEFNSICNETLKVINPLFESVENIRIHGDCHRSNILDRLDDGLMLIDFDDMMMGPAVQDLWLLLPGHFSECRVEMDMLLTGYTQFCDFDYKSLKLIEALRFMRIIYFLNWCSIQRKDHKFNEYHPNWGSEAFWIKEIEDLKYQLNRIHEHLNDDMLLMG